MEFEEFCAQTPLPPKKAVVKWQLERKAPEQSILLLTTINRLVHLVERVFKNEICIQPIPAHGTLIYGLQRLLVARSK